MSGEAKQSGLTIDTAPEKTLQDMIEILTNYCPKPLIEQESDITTDTGKMRMLGRLHRWQLIAELNTVLQRRLKQAPKARG